MSTSDFFGAPLLGKFTPRRGECLQLAASYQRLGFERRSEAVRGCGSFLEFAFEVSGSAAVASSGKLHSANFCRDRLCPMCAWRRSAKIYGQASQIMDVIRDKYDFLFLTLTCRNVSGELLSDTIDRMLYAWRKFLQYKRIKTVCMGCFRCLEVTRNGDLSSAWYDTYHPHLHIIMAVPHSYWHHGYISHGDLLSLWRKAFADPTISQVDIQSAADRVSKQTKSRTVAEIAKYAVKPGTYILDDDRETDSVVLVLAAALAGRRLVSYSGCFKAAFRSLHLDDPEEGDLIHVSGEINPDLFYVIVRYAWGAGCYNVASISFRGVDNDDLSS